MNNQPRHNTLARRILVLAGVSLIAAACLPIWTAAEEAQPMTVIYKRSGGFVGLNESLRIENLETLQCKSRKESYPERELSEDEKAELEPLLEAARNAETPPVDPPTYRIADAYQVALYLDDEEKPVFSMTTLNFPVTGLPEPWEALNAWMDSKLSQELSQHRRSEFHIRKLDELQERQ